MTTMQSEPETQKTGRRLDGKVAVITGGAQGIGRAIAEMFAGQGAQLVLVDVDEAKVQKTAEEIAASAGTKAIGLKTDVTTFADCQAAVKKTIDSFGKIDILVNNAGITRDNLLIRMSEEDWDLVLNVNLKGAYNFTKAVARPMMKARGGRIVNIASVVGLMGNPGQANYAASKGGLIAMTKSVAKELGSRNVLVNAVAPGFIETRLTESLSDEVKKQYIAWTPMGRFGKPEEVAKIVLFLASEDSSYVTGQVIGVNGGLYM